MRTTLIAKHMARLRRTELGGVRNWFGPGMKVLEIGGGSGFQAAIIASWGCEVLSFDLPGGGPEARYFPVKNYDGRKFPCPDCSIDIVFSSNALEHIGHLGEILRETRRILKPGGLAIHILPSPAWRFWTILSYYPYLLGHLIKRIFLPARNRSKTQADAIIDHGVGRPGILEQLIRALIPPPHGEYPSAFSELHYYSRARWQKQFEDSGFRIIDIRDNRLFYTGYVILPFVGIAMRRVLAAVFGSACNVFILR